MDLTSIFVDRIGCRPCVILADLRSALGPVGLVTSAAGGEMKTGLLWSVLP